MSDKELFAGFSEEQQEAYALEAEQMYDPETVRASNRKWKAYSPSEKERILKEGKAIYVDLIAAMPKGAGSLAVQALVERWRRNLEYFWTPSLDQLMGLVDMYNQDSRFKANFDQMHPGLAEFMREAVKVYVHGRKK